MKQITLRQNKVNVAADQTSSGSRPNVMQRKVKVRLLLAVLECVRSIHTNRKMKQKGKYSFIFKSFLACSLIFFRFGSRLL